jgi:hypothetical protein
LDGNPSTWKIHGQSRGKGTNLTAVTNGSVDEFMAAMEPFFRRSKEIFTLG